MKINKLLNDSKQDSKSISYTYGTVLSYDSDTCKAVVSLGEYNNAEKSFINKSGESLSVGDSVWIYYRGGGINSGYIAVRNGKPTPMGGGSDVGEFINYSEQSYINTNERFNDYHTNNVINETTSTIRGGYNTFRGNYNTIIIPSISTSSSHNLYCNYINGYDNTLWTFGQLSQNTILGWSNRIKMLSLNNSSIIGYSNQLDNYGSGQTYNSRGETYNTCLFGCNNTIGGKGLQSLYLVGEGNSIGKIGGYSSLSDNFHHTYNRISLLGCGNSINHDTVYQNDMYLNSITWCGCNNSICYDFPNQTGGAISYLTLFGDSNQLTYNSSYIQYGLVVGQNIIYDCKNTADAYPAPLNNCAIIGEELNFNYPFGLDTSVVIGCDSSFRGIREKYSRIYGSTVLVSKSSLNFNYSQSLASLSTHVITSSTVVGSNIELNLNNRCSNCFIGGNTITIEASSTGRCLEDMSFLGGYIHYAPDNYTDDYIGTVIGCGSLGRETYIDKNGNWSMFGTVTSSGGDYAEYWEWEDGNPNLEDRRGLFVSAIGDKIKKANEHDVIIGIVSANPSVIGNGDAYAWKDKYLKDVFGSIIYEEIREPITIDHQEAKAEAYIDENGKNHITQYKTIQLETGEYRTIRKPIINPKYDENQSYTPRGSRSEYCCVGHLGRLVMVDDGSCTENGYAKCSNGGIATKSEDITRARVLKRIDGTHVLVWWE